MKETFYTVKGCPVFLALLADLHNRPFSEVTDSLRKHRPERIAIAGDIVYGMSPEGGGLLVKGQRYVLPFLHACSGIAPTYLSLGNHEMMLCEEDLDLIRESGVQILDNSFAGSGSVLFGGLTSGYVTAYRKAVSASGTSRYPRIWPLDHPEIPDCGWLDNFARAPGFHILLSHHPEYLPLIPDGIELILSGHAHGGQWNYYSFREHRWKGVYAPGQGLFPKYTSGIYDGRMIVSRGLSNTTRVPRICNPEEIVYISG